MKRNWVHPLLTHIIILPIHCCANVHPFDFNELTVCTSWLKTTCKVSSSMKWTVIILLSVTSSRQGCLSVCMSIHLHISKTICPVFTKFSVYVVVWPVAVARHSYDNSALQCAMYFRFCEWRHDSHNRQAKGDAKTAYTESDSPGGSIPGRSLTSAIALFYCADGQIKRIGCCQKL